MTNPPNNMSWITPCLTVKDVDKANEFYKNTFGMTIVDSVPGEDGTTWWSTITHRGETIMLGKEGAWGGNTKAPATSGQDAPASLYLYVEDIDSFHKDATGKGATSVQNPDDMFWGDRMGQLKDIDGYVWSFASPGNK